MWLGAGDVRHGLAIGPRAHPPSRQTRTGGTTHLSIFQQLTVCAHAARHRLISYPSPSTPGPSPRTRTHLLVLLVPFKEQNVDSLKVVYERIALKLLADFGPNG